MTSSQYLKSVITISFCLFLSIGLFNYLINPFNIFDISRISNINEIKPEASKRIQVYKKYQPLFAYPDVLIVGNSRVEMGLDPDHEGFKEYLSRYNLGVPGVGIRSQVQYAQNIIDNTDVKMVLLSIDFADFLTAEGHVFNPFTLKIDPIIDRYSALWSLDSLKSSMATLFKQSEFESNRLNNGFNPAKDYLPIIQFEGQNVLFTQKINMLNNMLKGKVWNEALMLNSQHSDFSILNKHIDNWIKEGIEVHVFINPYHQDYYKTLKENGLFASFENWRVLMTDNFVGKLNFCDFTDLGIEKSQDKLTENELRYFWEPAHYKKELGDIMIADILNACD